MSARLTKASAAALRMRRQFDLDAMTVWLGVMAFLVLAAGATLAGH